MRKTKTKTVKQKVVETVDVLCNKCGETLNNGKRYWNDKHCQDFYGLEEVVVHGGYNSKFIGDMTSIRFSLCEECVDSLVKTFKHPVEYKGELSSDFVSKERYEALAEKQDKQNFQDWVNAVYRLSKELGLKATKKDLKTKSFQELQKLYETHTTSKRVQKGK